MSADARADASSRISGDWTIRVAWAMVAVGGSMVIVAIASRIVAWATAFVEG